MMQLSEAGEEILEALWIAHEAGNSKCTRLSSLREMPDARVLKELTDGGIIERCGDDGIELTERGIGEARDAIRRHRLAERLLTDVLAVRGELIHDSACDFEHHLHKGLDTNVCTLLGHPKACPHGKPIPPGKCCEARSRQVEQAVAPLANLKPGQGGRVAYLHTGEPGQAQMLLSMGVAPGAEIRLLAGFPSFLFQLGEGRFAVDGKVAREIYVRLSQN